MRRRKRQAVELAPDARNGDEDRGDGGERQLEAGLQERRRHPRHQHQRADGEEVPTVARARGEPRKRGESSGDRGAGHRRLPADGKHVGGDHAERRELPERSRESEEPAEQEDARGEERDVLPRDGEQVVETGGAEVVLHVVRQPFVLAEHDAENDAAADAGRAPPDGELDPVAKAIAEARQCPPRRPTCRQLDAFRTTWMPWRASQPRSSNPSSGPRGSSIRTVASRIAPRGGERPTGRMRRTRSCTCARRNVRAIAMTRVDHGEGRAGATVTSSATPASPRSAARTLSRSASIRSDPHASPRAARATPTATRRAPLPSISAPTTAANATAPATAIGTEAQIESASPTQAAPTRSAGQWSSTIRLTESRAPAAARSGSGRCREPRRGRRRRRTARARFGSR